MKGSVISRLALMGLLALPVGAAAQTGVTQTGVAHSVVGLGVIDRNHVNVVSGKTRRFAATDANRNACADGFQNVSLCGDRALRTSTVPSHTLGVMQHQYDARQYAIHVIEGSGTEDEWTQTVLRRAVVINTAKEVIVADSFKNGLSGMDAETSVINATVARVTFTNGASVRTQSKRSNHVITYAVGNSFSDAHRDIHNRFTTMTQVKRDD